MGDMKADARNADSDAASLPPVPLDQVLVLINRYIRSTGVFLNDFAAECDTRLCAVSRRIESLRMEVALLESKFDGDDTRQSNGTPRTLAPAEAANSTPRNAIAPQVDSPKLSASEDEEDQANAAAKIERTVASPPTTEVVSATAPTVAPASAVVVDPRASKYASMIKVGIPRDAVLIKMQLDGLGNLTHLV